MVRQIQDLPRHAPYTLPLLITQIPGGSFLQIQIPVLTPDIKNQNIPENSDVRYFQVVELLICVLSRMSPFSVHLAWSA